MFGAVCPGEGKAAAVIMPICNTIAMNHHLREISSQVGTAAHALLVLTPAGEAGRRLARQPGASDPRQHYLVGVAALQPRAQSGRAHLALSAQPLARQLGLSQSGRHHGRLRDGVEPLRRRPRLDPLAVRGRLGARLAPLLIRRSIIQKHAHPTISGDPYKAQEDADGMRASGPPPLGAAPPRSRCRSQKHEVFSPASVSWGFRHMPFGRPLYSGGAKARSATGAAA